MALTVKLTRQQRRVDTVKPKNLKSPKNGSERITMNCKIAEQQTRQIIRLDGDVTHLIVSLNETILVYVDIFSKINSYYKVIYMNKMITMIQVKAHYIKFNCFSLHF